MGREFCNNERQTRSARRGAVHVPLARLPHAPRQQTGLFNFCADLRAAPATHHSAFAAREALRDAQVDAALVGAQPLVSKGDEDDGGEGEREDEVGGDVPFLEYDTGIDDLGIPVLQRLLGIGLQELYCPKTYHSMFMAHFGPISIPP